MKLLALLLLLQDPLPVEAGKARVFEFEAGSAGVAVFTHVGGFRSGSELGIHRDGKPLDVRRHGDDRWCAFAVTRGKHSVELRSAKGEDVVCRVEVVREPRELRVEPGRAFSVRMLTADEERTIRVDVPGDGFLECRQLDVSRSAELEFEMDGKPVEARWGGPDRWAAVPVAAGEHRIRIHGAVSLAPIRLRIDFDTRMDELEPNDTAEQATPVYGVAHIRSYPPGDVDWVEVKAEAPSILRVTHLNPGVIRYSLLLEGVGELPFRTTTAVNLPAGTHRIRMTGNDYSRIVQKVRFQVRAQDDEFEPNNRAADAARVPFDRPFSFVIRPLDQDWFRVNLPSDGILSFRFEGRPLSQPRIEVGGVALDPPVLEGKTGPVLFRVRNLRASDERLTMSVSFSSAAPAADPRFILVTVGEPDLQLKWTARAGGSELMTAEDLARLPDMLEMAVHAGREKERKSLPKPKAGEEGGFGPALVIGVALLGLGVLVVLFRLSRRPRGGGFPDSGL